MTAWTVYLLECTDGTLYCGITTNLHARTAAHNAGKGARYTRGRTPVRVVWHEDGHTRSDALRREHAVKRLPRAQKLRLLASKPAPAPRASSRRRAAAPATVKVPGPSAPS